MDELTLSGLVVVFSLGIGVGICVTSEGVGFGAGLVVVFSLCGDIDVTSEGAWFGAVRSAVAAQSSRTVLLRCCIWL